MDSYEINKDTVALVPKDKNHTTIYETDNSFVVDKPVLSIVKESCEYFGSALVGFTHKVPVIVEESFDLIIFPTLSPKNEQCAWVVYDHVFKPEKFKDKTILVLKNGKKILIDSSDAIIENQLYRCSRLKESLKLRKIDKK